jgi:hypothetical protein
MHSASSLNAALLMLLLLMLLLLSWAARYNTWLLIKLTPQGVAFSFSFLLLLLPLLLSICGMTLLQAYTMHATHLAASVSWQWH